MEGLREYDVPYHERWAIDSRVRCAKWYSVERVSTECTELTLQEDMVRWAEPRVCAFDIETTKLPLQFPNAEYDQVFMISYMLDTKGYLIINREVVSEDIKDFEYTPKPEFPAEFEIFNEANEEDCILRWVRHMQETQPMVYVTYNGDWFDWPFMFRRSEEYGISLEQEIGFAMNDANECRSESAVHIDAFYWVKRDSYLPQGSQGLKAVTKAKLRYEPVEVDPEDMVIFADTDPQHMASYSVSDAVATYYLYMKYVHPFIFSLSTIIPLPPDEVLRKGSGTLCEALLMVQAAEAGILCPNKHNEPSEKWAGGRLLEKETYIGGHVECLESGVYRSDFPTNFHLKPSAYKELIESLDQDIRYAIEVENKCPMEEIVDYEAGRKEVLGRLEELSQLTTCEALPLIYHLDVAAMYPNIILTNRLQPHAMLKVEDGMENEACEACAGREPGDRCFRAMEWKWRGEHYAATQNEVQAIKKQIAEDMAHRFHQMDPRDFFKEKRAMLKQRLQKYCQKVYKRVMDKPVTKSKMAAIDMKANNFYVDTVQKFRDRRYEYKGLNKKWGGKLKEAKASGVFSAIKEASDMVILYDSLQLAHKCILNSFYGYVMRKGARWYSMEMAGVVTYTGAKIIQRACKLVEGIGKPLELDTDGIWAALPGSFPEDIVFHTKSGKKVTVSYPCAILNSRVAVNDVNTQYHACQEEGTGHNIESRMTIEFEVDGPYKAMILPATQEEGKLIKKRYAVFNFDGSLAELKGFELKRRGELKLIKAFQSEVFECFLDGATLEECYDSCAAIANRWLDLLDSQGADLLEEEVLEYIADSTTMSKSLEEYADKKSCAITTARRLSEFLGDSTLGQGNLNCTYIVARHPEGLPTSERAIPVTVFQAKKEVARSYLQKWCKVAIPEDKDFLRSVVDWEYYKGRLGKAIQKIITIPAALQDVANPVPRVKHPDWVRTKKSRVQDAKQMRLTGMLDANRVTAEQRALAGASSPARENGTVSREGRPGGAEEGPQPGPASEPPPAPLANPRQDYRAWVKGMKEKWRARFEKSNPSRMRKGVRVRGSMLPASVPQYYMEAERQKSGNYWHVLGIFKADNGVCKGWVFSSSQGLQCVTLSSRTVSTIQGHLDSQDRFASISLRCSESHLLGDRVTGPADSYNIISQMTDVCATRVQGAGTSESPLLNLGCVISCSPDSGGGWSEHNTRMVLCAECPYLQDVSVNALYLHRARADRNSLWMMYSSLDAKASFACVVPGRGRDRDLTPGLLQQISRKTGLPVNEGAGGLSVEYFGSEADLWKVWLKRLASHRGRPSLLLQDFSPASVPPECAETLQSLAPQIQLCRADKLISGLQWQVSAAKIASQRCVSALDNLDEDLQAARYGHIPMANFSGVPGERYHTVSNVIFSRMLSDENVELKRREVKQQDVCPFKTLRVKPGVYRSPCIELRIYHLLINAILQSTLDVQGLGGKHFALLRTLCERWVVDATKNRSKLADRLLSNLQDWIFHSDGSVWDEEQQLVLQKLMETQLEALLTKIERPGFTVLSATCRSIIVCVDAAGSQAAEVALQQVLNSVLQSFEFVKMEPVVTWETLMYQSPFNFSGVHFVPVSPDEEADGDAGMADADGEIKLEVVWLDAKGLNDTFYREFQTLLGDFIFLPWKHATSTISADQDTERMRALQAEHLEQSVLLHMQERLKSIEMDIKTAYGQETDAALPQELLQLEQFMSVLFSAMELDADNRALVTAMRKTVWEKPREGIKKKAQAPFTWICSSCSQGIDIDLCACAAVPTQCPQMDCAKEQDLAALEGSLLLKLQQCMRESFQARTHTRDCIQKSGGRSMTNCKCGSRSMETLQIYLGAMSAIARRQRFRHLASTVSQCSAMCGAPTNL